MESWKASLLWCGSFFLIHLLRMSPFVFPAFWLFCEGHLIQPPILLWVQALTPVHLSPTLCIPLKSRSRNVSFRICLPLWSRAFWMFLDFVLLYISICIYLWASVCMYVWDLGGFSLNIWSLLEVEDHAFVLIQSFPYVVLTGLRKPRTKGKK